MSFYRFLNANHIQYGSRVPSSDMTHNIIIHTTESMTEHRVKLKLTTLDQYKALYARQGITILCNPGMEQARKLYMDIDGYKPEKGIVLNDDQVLFIKLLFCKYAAEYYGATDFIVMDKPEGRGNIHITANCVVPDVYYSRFIITKMRQIILHFAENTSVVDDTLTPFDNDFIATYFNQFTKEQFTEIFAAVDNAPGIRALYSAKPGAPNDFYKPENGDASDKMRDCLKADPNYIYGLELANIDLLYDTEVRRFKANAIERRARMIPLADYMNDVECADLLPLDAVISDIRKIPTIFIKSYYSFKAILSQVRSQFSSVDEERNEAIIRAFDDICQKDQAGYNADNNAEMYVSGIVERGGFAVLQNKIKTYLNNKLTPQQYLVKRINTAIEKPTFVNYNADITINMPYLDIVFNEYDAKTLSIKSATGTGKTTNLLRFIRANPEAKVLYLGCRKSLLQSLKSSTMDNGALMFDHYETADFEAARSRGYFQRLLIQMESIGRLNYNIINAFDYIICDEFNGLVSQISSPNYVNVRSALGNLLNVFQSNAQIVLLDGNLDNNYINILDVLRPAKAFNRVNIINTHQNKTGEKMVFVSSLDDIKSIVIDKIAADKKLVIATDSKNVSKIYEQLIINENAKLNRVRKILIIHGDNSATLEIQEILKNINTAILDYHYLIYSPSISAGVDINPVLFDVQFNIFTKTTSSINENLQMTNRARCKIDNVSYTYINKPHQNNLSFDQYIDEYKSRNYQVSGSCLADLCIVPIGSHNLVIETHPIIKALVNFKMLKTSYNNNFVNRFINAIKSQGYLVELYTPETVVKIAADCKTGFLKDKYKTIEAQTILNAKPINHDKQTINTLQMRAEKNKYIINETYGPYCEASEIDEDFIKEYGSYDKIAKFKRRVAIHNTRDIDAAISEITTADEMIRTYDEQFEWSNLLNNKNTSAHHLAGLQLLSAIYGDVSQVIKNTPVITRAQLLIRLQNASILPLSQLVSMFRFRGKTSGVNTLYGLFAKKNTKTAVSLINNIFMSLYGISIKRVDRRSPNYELIISGFNPKWNDT